MTRFKSDCILRISVAVILICSTAETARAVVPRAIGVDKCEGVDIPGTFTPAPADPFPLNAAGWGPEFGNGLLASRWAENWTGMRLAGNALAFKAIPLGMDAHLTLSTEARFRYDLRNNAQLVKGNDFQQVLFRGVVGADLQFNPHFRIYSEVATGQVGGRRETASANLQNNASFQQLFADARGHYGTILFGVMIGRQEFTDGPRQIISLSDGPNIHRTWNGFRVYVHENRARFGAFELRATRQGKGSFDEDINYAERLRGLNASFIVSSGTGPNTYFDPFWINSESPNSHLGDRTGTDNRDTVGARLWGRQGNLRFDWTLAHQTGKYMQREIDAWGLFGSHSLLISEFGWKPRTTARLDVASGGATYGNGPLRSFNQLYGSSNYLGEGQLLGLSNLMMITPGFSFSPTPTSSFAIEYGLARRFSERDAAYAGGMRAYSGTQNVKGHEIGGLFRATGSWSTSRNFTLSVDFEYLNAGKVLRSAGVQSGSYGYVGATYRY